MDESRCGSIDKIPFLEVYKIPVDTNTGEMEIFHPIVYAENLTDTYTPRWQEYMCVPYKEGFIDAMGDNIYTI